MKLPAWARANHPVAHREAAVWRQIYKKWGWLMLFLFLLPCGCSALCSLTALPAAFAADTPATALIIFLAWSILLGLWLTSGLWAWILSTLAGVGGAVMVARERETLNWGLLRLTTLSVREILAAKLAALGRLLLWPSIAILGLETVGVTLMIVGGLVGVFIAGRASPSDVPPLLQVELAVLLIGLWPLSVLYLVVANVLSLLYNAVLGLLTSSFSRTTGNAVVMTFLASFVINLLVFVPLEQLVGIGLQALGGVMALVTQSPVAFFILTPLASFILPLLIQVLMTILLLAFAVRQSESIVE